MKYILTAILFSLTFVLNATNYYVAPNGNDNNPGTISQPWASWQKGFSSLKAGDILYIRGGNYTKMYGSGHGVNISGRDGSKDNVITVSAYPGETPVLDCSSLSESAGVNFGILMRDCDYWNIKGLTVKNVREYKNLSKSAGGSPTAGWEIGNSSNITLEQCVVTESGNGFTLNGTLYNIKYVNCDAYRNYDYYDNGGLANGFNGNVRGNSTIFYIGCRSWLNSDDGYDNYGGSGYLVYNDCWAFSNGKGTPTIGNGDGFKLGYDKSNTELPGSQRTLHNCVSVDNTLMGFDEGMDEGTGMDMELFNCIAYKNSRDYGFRFDQTRGTSKTTLRNNISFANRINYSGRSRNTSDHNSWDAGAPAVSEADFVSLDFSGFNGPRKPDGSLPEVSFSLLKSGSDLIDAGTNVGLPFSGKAPDLGAYELKSAITAPSGPSLAYVSSVVNKTNPSILDLTYNVALANVVPAATSFEIKVNSEIRSISKITIADKIVQITLARPVESGDAVSFSYTKPSTDPLQCSSGTFAESVTGKSVTNSLVALPAPKFISAQVASGKSNVIEMMFDVKLASVVPSTSSFVIKINGTTKNPESVTISESNVILSLPVSVKNTDVITIAYNKPAENSLQSTQGGKVESLTDQPVLNNVKGPEADADSLFNDGKITIFPNPAKDYINIANATSGNDIPLLRIYDISGKLCQEIKLENITRIKKVPVSLKSGFYVTQLISGTEVLHVQKLIIVK